jgi:predicted RNA-binding protein with PUA-like domain
MKYWLIKSEPNEFSIDDLRACPGKRDRWDGVRNYQARNMMRDEMKVGDPIFFYHSNCDVPGIVGLAKVVRKGYVDMSAFDVDDKHYDPKSDPDNPRWIHVDVGFVRKLKRTISLAELKQQADALGDFALTRRGNRLSVMPVSKQQWDYVLGLEQSATE